MVTGCAVNVILEALLLFHVYLWGEVHFKLNYTFIPWEHGNYERDH